MGIPSVRHRMVCHKVESKYIIFDNHISSLGLAIIVLERAHALGMHSLVRIKLCNCSCHSHTALLKII